MDFDLIIRIVRDSLLQILLLSAPMLGISMFVGLLISIFQATTSIQEQTLTFVPKIISIFLALIVFGNWMLATLIDFSRRLFDMIPLMTR
ncbi:MAG TPA: flagellar biosynthesis protein FliQ [Spirochaetota bacterium]|nr:flagellar biosynthesis protein FliQ [Spirochaetota bacterium]HPH02668.1 flagellar biosynthesis protein FliQ [Spirochaetota bacterium]HPN82053.1 flagellar biosynthesis protein FliQ [Spirochaetota bacterium]